MSDQTYQNPLGTRYASSEMSAIFSNQHKYTLWRKLWIELAKAEKSLGLNITDAQIQELQDNAASIDFKAVAQHEHATRHDVMAHLLAYADQCPQAKPIIHLGATSCFLTDNTDLIQAQQGLNLIQAKLIGVIRHLRDFAIQYKALPCLSFTHFQPAQPTTVGKRACLWLQDFLTDFNEVSHRLNHLSFLGLKGATGTQASFMNLFDRDQNKVLKLEQLIAKQMGFKHIYPISGQTYSRKQDVLILNSIVGVAVSAHKMATDLRLLAHLREVEETFEETQVGSSAMPYKRNPIRSERICSLARYAISLSENPNYTAATQWLERSLDDSANRRLCLPECFLSIDAILQLLLALLPNLVVNPQIIQKHLHEELPFLLTEDILMSSVKRGGDRQLLHERIRVHSHAALKKIKEGSSNDLFDRILRDPLFNIQNDEIQTLLNSHALIGRSKEQVDEFIRLDVSPVLEKYGNIKLEPVNIKI